VVAKKLYYKIGEACKELDIQPYVLRYWETEFQALSPSKSKSGQRVYSADDLGLIRRIKELLYKEGYTIAGAKKKLESEVVSKPVAVDDPADERSEPEEAPQESASEVEQPDPKAAAAPKPVNKKTARTSPPADSSATDKKTVARLQKGIRSALQEAKDILEILDRP
jgi:DNA-binding transcriptional MerR regulator